MSTLVAQTISNGTVSTSTANVINGAKAWVNFNGTGTVAIRASYNVSSITDNGTGEYTVNFTNALTDANYVINVNANMSYGAANIASPGLNTQGGGASESAPTTTSCRFYIATLGNAAFDPKYVNVAIFR
jgi:hypothetical protein